MRSRGAIFSQFAKRMNTEIIVATLFHNLPLEDHVHILVQRPPSMYHTPPRTWPSQLLPFQSPPDGSLRPPQRIALQWAGWNGQADSRTSRLRIWGNHLNSQQISKKCIQHSISIAHLQLRRQYLSRCTIAFSASSRMTARRTLRPRRTTRSF
jgi:hypothetical protein